jgi:hypothetical protein
MKPAIKAPEDRSRDRLESAEDIETNVSHQCLSCMTVILREVEREKAFAARLKLSSLIA